MEQINNKHFYSRQKGRALSMLASNESICKLNRKRKREYSVYDINNEEEKEYKTKRHKPLNMKNQSNDQELWNETYQKQFKNEL